MSSISSIDTTLTPGLIEGFAPKTLQPIQPFNPETEQSSGGYSYGGGGYSDSNSDVDLSNYYSNIRPEDLLTQVGQNVSKSAQDLDNAMVSAIQNGYGVNEACNIKNAEIAYRANAYMFKIANEMSTFVLEV